MQSFIIVRPHFSKRPPLIISVSSHHRSCQIIISSIKLSDGTRQISKRYYFKGVNCAAAALKMKHIRTHSSASLSVQTRTSDSVSTTSAQIKNKCIINRLRPAAFHVWLLLLSFFTRSSADLFPLITNMLTVIFTTHTQCRMSEIPDAAAETLPPATSRFFCEPALLLACIRRLNVLFCPENTPRGHPRGVL